MFHIKPKFTDHLIEPKLLFTPVFAQGVHLDPKNVPFQNGGKQTNKQTNNEFSFHHCDQNLKKQTNKQTNKQKTLSQSLGNL